MIKDGHERGKQKWQCATKESKRQAALYADPVFKARKRATFRSWYYDRGGKELAMRQYAERKELGICTKCGRQLAISNSLCWDCLNYHESRYAGMAF